LFYETGHHLRHHAARRHPGHGDFFSILDKIRVAQKLDAFGVDFIEGGWPGSNPRDAAFFAEAAKLTGRMPVLRLSAAHGVAVSRSVQALNAQVRVLLEAQTPVVTIVGKTWLLHVTEVLNVTAEENLAMIADTWLTEKARTRSLYDAEHFFDSYKDNPEYSLQTLRAARDAVRICSSSAIRMAELCRVKSIASRQL
jgi:2-isopropylmalate synthase